MPLVRIVRTVVRLLTLATVVETAKTMMAIANRSIPTPAWSAIGSSTTQPTGRPPTKSTPTSNTAALTSVQRLNALSRGKAMSRAPTMMGMTKFAHGPAMATISARIITMPWIAIKLLYTC